MTFQKGFAPWNKKPRVKIQCINCSKEYEVIPSRVAKARFCSISCKASYTFKGRQSPMKGRRHSDASKSKISNSLLGRCLSEEHKRKLSSRVFTAEHRRKLSERAKNREVTPEMIKRLSDCYRAPHTIDWKKKMSIIMTGRKNPKISLALQGHSVSVNTRKKISQSKLGRKFLKISEKLKGRKLSPETRRKISLNNGTKREDVRKRLSAVKMGACPKHLIKFMFKDGNQPWFRDDPTKNPMYGCSKNKNPFYGKTHTEESLKKMREAQIGRVGVNAAHWIDGRSFLPYCHKFNEKTKEKIRIRDNRTCQLCGAKEGGKKLCIHHIHYDKQNCDPDLISLCEVCHAKTLSNRDYYEKLFCGMLKKVVSGELPQ